MDFVADNDLRVIDCKALLKEQESKQQGEVPVERVLLAQAIEENMQPRVCGSGQCSA